MDKNEKLKILQGLNEKSLTERYLIPLYSEGMKYKNVRYNHGILESGKDVIYYTEDEYGHPVYTGVQVKAAKITSRSIDTMCRQITEALGSPFTDLGDGKKKDLDRIVLVTSHEFKGKAKESFWSSLEGANPHIKRVVTCVDGNELVGLFDKYLPSIFWKEYGFFSKYFQAMKKEFETIKDVSAIGQREPIPLEEIYVSLKLNERKEYILHEREIEEEVRKIGPEKDKESPMIEERREKERIFDADDIVRKFDKVVIVGAPGSGKTTLLKHLALKSCMENLEKQERITVPVLITLRQLLESGKNLRDYMDDVFAQFNFPEAADFIEEDMKDGKCLILLDGFDELAAVEKQLEVTRRIEELISKYHKNRFIVTSRTAGYHGELKEFPALEVKEFDDKQIEKFITNWFSDTNPEKAKSMNKAIKENERIRKLARNPLMIAIIAVIYEEDRELPQRRVELYQRCVEVLLSKWDVQRRIKNKYDMKAKEKVLRKLALEAHILEKKSFTEKEILEKFSEHLPEVKIEKDKAEDVLKEIIERNALLKEISIGVYDFLHLSFQEYLTALELRGRSDYQTLLNHFYEPWWEEVVLLFAGFDRDATDLILKIKEKEKEDEQFREDIFHSNLMLLGKCIADADYTDATVKEEIVNDLWHLYENEKPLFLGQRAMSILALIKPDSIVNLLIENLGDEDRYVRGRAAEALGKIGSEKVVDSLVEALQDESSSVRGSAAEALGKIGSEKAVPFLIEALQDESSSVRGSAAEALGKIGSEKAVPFLIEALKDEDSDVRRRAAEALGKTKSEKAVPFLVEALKDEDRDVRWRAAEALGNTKSEKAVPFLVEALQDESSSVRGSAAEALGKIGSEKAVPFLVEALKDEDRDVQGRAAEALGKTKSEKAVPFLVEALKDEDRDVQGRAAEALGKIGSEKAVPFLVEALKDEDRYVQGSAAEALGKIGSEKAVPFLIEALKDIDRYVRWSAAEALGNTKSEKAVPPLVETLQDIDIDVRRRAAYALGEIGSEKAIPFLVEALQDIDRDVRWRAAEALGNTKSEKAVPPLVEALQDESSTVRGSAAYALGHIGSEKAVPPLVEALQDESSDVQGGAAYALEKISKKLKKRIIVLEKEI
jgi:HEAT repeat protein